MKGGDVMGSEVRSAFNWVKEPLNVSVIAGFLDLRNVQLRGEIHRTLGIFMAMKLNDFMEIAMVNCAAS